MPVLLPHRVAESRVQGFVTDLVSDHVKKNWPWEDSCAVSLNNVQTFLLIDKSVHQGSSLFLHQAPDDLFASWASSLLVALTCMCTKLANQWPWPTYSLSSCYAHAYLHERLCCWHSASPVHRKLNETRAEKHWVRICWNVCRKCVQASIPMKSLYLMGNLLS